MNLSGSFSSLEGIPLDPSFGSQCQTETKSSEISLTVASPPSSYVNVPQLSNRELSYEFRETWLLFGQKDNLPTFSVCWQFTVGWTQTSKQGYDREIRQLEKAIRYGCTSGNVKFLYVRTLGCIYLTWVMPVLKENSQWGPGCDHWVCSSLLKPTPGPNRTSFREAYTQTGSHNLAVGQTPWLQGVSHSRKMHSQVAFWPAALNAYITEAYGYILSLRAKDYWLVEYLIQTDDG